MLGNRFENLTEANRQIEERVGKIRVISSYYETEAWGYTDQPLFINQAISVETKLSPMELLSTILDIEHQMGRVRLSKWTERLIDIDILFYNDAIIQEKMLIIPHSRITERNFVLIPMEEIAPNFIHPVLQKNMMQLKKLSKDKLAVYQVEIIKKY